jgi:predicted TIM-barrel fold metal-dependent hydrolase
MLSLAMVTRRHLIGALGLGPALLAQQAKKGTPLDITEFEPKSRLSVPETNVERAKFPVVDVHTHISFSRDEKSMFRATPEQLLDVMNRRNIRTMVNLTGGRGEGLREAVQKYDKAHPGRFITFTEPSWSRANEPDYAKFQADAIRQAVRDGARGVKVLKTLGLFLRNTDKTLVKIDDPRFDPMWETCGSLGIPVSIHVGDPAAFFDPIDRYNERFEELNNHPDWSFHGKDFPPLAEILAARDRVFARHPKTQFIALHVGHFAEDLAHVSASLDKFRNMHVEIGARIGELGRQPRTARRFFDRYQDHIMFGTDAVPNGHETPQQVFGDQLYKIYYRFLETEDEYFDYAPAPVPPQGRWRIYGVGLPDGILRKVYHENADRVLKVKA